MENGVVREIESIIQNGVTLANLKMIISIWPKIPQAIKEKLKAAILRFFSKKEVAFDVNSLNSELFLIDKSNTNFKRLKGVLVNREYIAILRLAEHIKWLNENNLHLQATDERNQVFKRYDQKGINIVDMVGTGDISVIISFLDKITGEPNEQKLRFNQYFDKFVTYYPDFCLMIQTKMSDSEIRVGILNRISKGNSFVLVNFLADRQKTLEVDRLLFSLLDETLLDGFELQRNIFKVGHKYQYHGMFLNSNLEKDA